MMSNIQDGFRSRMRKAGIAGAWDTPRDLGCQWIKHASRKPLEGVHRRAARGKSFQ